MKPLKLHPWIVMSLVLAIIITALSFTVRSQDTVAAYHGGRTFWKYQCIDTMKTSRDKAREWATRADLKGLIDSEMSLIAGTGANCVAIDTPYDPEFLPLLKTWVASARTRGLHIWFRGNFSSWEGWFNYPKGMTQEQLLASTREFILANPALFEDGDIFTAAPEAENGGPFNQVEPYEYDDYHQFLIEESRQTAATFAQIKKQVRVNWASMNGGLAQRMLDQATVDTLDRTVTIDHYIKTAPEMGEYIDYFASTFGAKLVIGEWGAPIPEFNGNLTPTQQAAFVSQLLDQMAVRSGDIEGVNYWTLTDGSTRLVDDGFIKRPVYDVIKRYYSPAVIKGTVRNDRGQGVAGATVQIESAFEATTDAHGNYSMLVPSGSAKVTVRASGYVQFETKLELPINRELTLDPVIKR